VGTSEDPVASMQLQLKWNVHTIIKDITSKAVYYVQGDGHLEEIGTPFRNAQNAMQKQLLDHATRQIENVSFD
jgi:hypothetical protein